MTSLLESKQEVFSVKQASAIIGKSEKALRRRIERRQIQVVPLGDRSGRSIGILKQELIRFINGWPGVRLISSRAQ